MTQKGDFVFYVDEFDSDKSYSPNFSPALVTKTYPGGFCDLVVFFSEGFFVKKMVQKGDATERQTWYPRS